MECVMSNLDTTERDGLPGFVDRRPRPATDVQVIEPREVTPAAVLTPMVMLDRAVSQGADIAILEKLMALQERWEANQARKAFDEAMATARGEIPPIMKNRQVGFKSKKLGASDTNYRHEDLAEIARTIDPILGKSGLSYRFRTTSLPNEPITVTCIVSHRDGHSEQNTLSAGRDDSGNKNSIQAIGSTITYLQRYTLKAALGLAAANDDDGKSSGEGSGTITDDQAADLQQLVVSTQAKIDPFLEFLSLASGTQIESLSDIPAAHFNTALAALKAKVKAKAPQQ